MLCLSPPHARVANSKGIYGQNASARLGMKPNCIFCLKLIFVFSCIECGQQACL
jgi:hypothetical protein